MESLETIALFCFVYSFFSYLVSIKFKRRKQKLANKVVNPFHFNDVIDNILQERNAHLGMITFRFISFISFALSLFFIGIDMILYVVKYNGPPYYLFLGILCICAFVIILINFHKFKKQIVDRC